MASGAALHLRQRLQTTVTAAVTRLPPAILRLLAGGGRVQIDGLELAPEVQLALRVLELAGHRGLETMTPVEARDEIASMARRFAGPPLSIARVEPRSIPGPVGDIPARLYVPHTDARPRPLVVYFHGGGWVVGDLDTHDGVCRFLARELDGVVLAVDYRLAPEHRFPAAVEDAFAAFEWAAREAASFGADSRCIAVAGDSAGGNLAAAVAQLAARGDGARPAAQLLIYPVTDLSRKHPSYGLFARGFMLTEQEMDWYRGHYLPDAAAARDPRTSPLLAPDLRGVAPAIVLTAGFDVLRDEGEAYARRLEGAGVRTALRRHAGLIHGFCNSVGVSPLSRAAMIEAARLLSGLVARA